MSVCLQRFLWPDRKFRESSPLYNLQPNSGRRVERLGGIGMRDKKSGYTRAAPGEWGLFSDHLARRSRDRRVDAYRYSNREAPLANVRERPSSSDFPRRSFLPERLRSCRRRRSACAEATSMDVATRAFAKPNSDRAPRIARRCGEITLAAFQFMCNPPDMFFCRLQYIES